MEPLSPRLGAHKRRQGPNGKVVEYNRSALRSPAIFHSFNHRHLPPFVCPSADQKNTTVDDDRYPTTTLRNLTDALGPETAKYGKCDFPDREATVNQSHKVEEPQVQVQGGACSIFFDGQEYRAEGKWATLQQAKYATAFVTLQGLESKEIAARNALVKNPQAPGYFPQPPTIPHEDFLAWGLSLKGETDLQKQTEDTLLDKPTIFQPRKLSPLVRCSFDWPKPPKPAELKAPCQDEGDVVKAARPIDSEAVNLLKPTESVPVSTESTFLTAKPNNTRAHSSEVIHRIAVSVPQDSGNSPQSIQETTGHVQQPSENSTQCIQQPTADFRQQKLDILPQDIQQNAKNVQQDLHSPLHCAQQNTALGQSKFGLPLEILHQIKAKQYFKDLPEHVQRTLTWAQYGTNFPPNSCLSPRIVQQMIADVQRQEIHKFHINTQQYFMDVQHDIDSSLQCFQVDQNAANTQQHSGSSTALLFADQFREVPNVQVLFAIVGSQDAQQPVVTKTTPWAAQYQTGSYMDITPSEGHSDTAQAMSPNGSIEPMVGVNAVASEPPKNPPQKKYRPSNKSSTLPKYDDSDSGDDNNNQPKMMATTKNSRLSQRSTVTSPGTSKRKSGDKDNVGIDEMTESLAKFGRAAQSSQGVSSSSGSGGASFTGTSTSARQRKIAPHKKSKVSAFTFRA